MTTLKCPTCGASDRFEVDHFVEHHTAILDACGTWVEDVECFDSELPDGCSLTCPSCGHREDYNAFCEAGEAAAQDGSVEGLAARNGWACWSDDRFVEWFAKGGCTESGSTSCPLTMREDRPCGITREDIDEAARAMSAYAEKRNRP